MFFKQIATLTADHLREHIAAYLAVQQSAYGVPLVMPKKIEVASTVGGVMDENDVPTYALDSQTKTASEDLEDLNTWIYSGQLTGLVGALSANESDDLVKGHAAACEMFVREHQFLTSSSQDFTLVEFAHSIVEFTGALAVGSEDSPWYFNAFRIDLSWLISEDARHQH